MRFDSITFILFLIIVLGVYYILHSWYLRKTLLLISSYLFYAAWNPPFVVLLWFSTCLDWFAAKRIAGSATPIVRRFWLVVSLSTNLGLLGFFKYGGFVLESFQIALQQVGIDYSPPNWNIIIPIGISFYTFQTLSYTIDVYRKNIPPSGSFIDFAMYVTFFPQLVAGPIVRASDFLPQCQKEKQFHLEGIAWGGALVVLGLFEKQILSDRLFAPVADEVYSQTFQVSFVTAWTGTLAFSGQIFCDFAGYSTTAIGCARMLGFTIPDNFRSPYAAVGFSDFWQRWHISLSSWLRDYLYIPLGGNRRGAIRTQANLMMTMLIGGLWHGAAWTFVAWGVLHGLYLVGERHLGQWWTVWKSKSRVYLILPGLLTFTLVTVAWVPFRAVSFRQTFDIWSAMFGSAASGSHLTSIQVYSVLAGIVLLVSAHWMFRDRGLVKRVSAAPVWVISIMLAVMIYLILTLPSEDRAFIYFQF